MYVLKRGPLLHVDRPKFTKFHATRFNSRKILSYLWVSVFFCNKLFYRIVNYNGPINETGHTPMKK